MKRITRSLSTLLLTLSLATTANAGGTPVSATDAVVKKISRMITYPESVEATHDVEVVLVSFRLESCGMITVLETNSSSDAFRNYVVSKLEAMRFDGRAEEVHHMRFTFKKND